MTCLRQILHQAEDLLSTLLIHPPKAKPHRLSQVFLLRCPLSQVLFLRQILRFPPYQVLTLHSIRLLVQIHQRVLQIPPHQAKIHHISQVRRPLNQSNQVMGLLMIHRQQFNHRLGQAVSQLNQKYHQLNQP